MVNVIIDKNLSQNDLNTLECWVKNKQMTLQRDKCKMLFGSLKKSMVIMGGKKNLLAVVLVEKRHLGFIWLKAQYKLLNLGRQLKSGINGTIMYWSWEVTPCSMVRLTWRLVFVYLLFSSVQFLSHVPLFATPWIAARQASLSITNSQSSPKLMYLLLDGAKWVFAREGAISKGPEGLEAASWGKLLMELVFR